VRQLVLEATLPTMSNPSSGSLTSLEAEKVEMSGLCGINKAVLKAPVQVQDGIDQTPYFAATEQIFVMVQAFQKKSHKPPKRELVKARERMNDFLASDISPT
jgi:phage-related protein